MPDLKEIKGHQNQTMDVVPDLPEPVVEFPVPVVSELITETSRAENKTNNLLLSTLHQSVNINLDVSVNSSVTS